MSLRLMTEVWSNPVIEDRSEVLLLLALADWSNDRGEAFPSFDSLAERTRSSRSTVIRKLKDLESRGWIEVYRGGGRKANVYRLTLPTDRSTDRSSDEGSHDDTPPSGITTTPQTYHGDTPAVSPRHPSSVTVEPQQSHHDTPGVSSFDTPGVSPGDTRTSIEPRSTYPTYQGDLQSAHGGNGGGGGWIDFKARLTAEGIRPTGWTPERDAEAAALLQRHGVDALWVAATAGTRPAVLGGALTRWREISDTTPPLRRIQRCEDHGLTHHGVCPSCRADELAGTA